MKKEKNKIEVGAVFNRLTVLEVVPASFGGKITCLCSCSCGGSKTTDKYGLLNGRATSCGCFAIEKSWQKTHGKTGTPLYQRYHTMLQRCANPKAQGYSNYGGRGITVCARWLESFENFFEDMGEPTDGMTLERKDNDKGYSLDNCCWVPLSDQQRNKRDTFYVEWEGQIVSLRVLAEKYEVPRTRVYMRYKSGWPLHECLFGRNKFN